MCFMFKTYIRQLEKNVTYINKCGCFNVFALNISFTVSYLILFFLIVFILPNIERII